jgi:hypothetical protein
MSGNTTHKPDCACPWCRNGRKEPSQDYLRAALRNPTNPPTRAKLSPLAGPTGPRIRTRNPKSPVFLDRGCSEWSFAWGRVPTTELSSCKEPGCPCVEDPESRESWQYMGTERQELHPHSWFHCFRHRRYPGTGEREYWRVQASPEWSRDQNDGTRKNR